ncbi:hypothetical protein EJ08DRAFT_216005 [Tothia fuscella]|uniref:Hemerythrin-like domain-containing protein n=1 Tax=Tothia fuscella TaxID=1048955 RepID=A0A9P4NS58_9PEZI|nr:hypothetical protein EJ08DRAFT_216005 [Tothia fuscella]
MPSTHKDLSSWADTPFPLIPTPCGSRSLAKEHGSRMMAHEMTQLHNCILHVLNCVYNQAPHVTSPKDIKDLLHLVKLWHDELEHHHQTEEQCFFPAIERLSGEKGVMEGNIDQHHRFEPGLEALKKYALETRIEEYNAGDLRAIIDNFGDILQTHLNDEIDTLLDLKHYDSGELKACWAETHNYVLKTCDSRVQLPMLLGSMDRTYEGKAQGLSMPWFLYYLVEFWFSREHKDSWRFLPCTTWGKPKPLWATGAVKS